MSYKSKGTVRFIDIKSRRLIFVPDNDHSAKNGDKDCAVFFHGIDPLNQSKIVDLDPDDRGVPVTLTDSFVKDTLACSLLASAAVAQIKVEIGVDIPSSVDLIDIGLPAK